MKWYKENAMNKDLSFIIGRAAALSIAVETIVFAFSLIWEVVFPTEFATNLGYIASLLIAIMIFPRKSGHEGKQDRV
jgi:hypothetical protein